MKKKIADGLHYDNTRPIDPNDPTQTDRNNYRHLPNFNSTLAGLVMNNSPNDIRLMARMAGHPMTDIPESEGKFEIVGKKKNEAVQASRSEIRRGALYFHSKRQTKVTVLQTDIDITASGEPIHLVIESGTAHRFKAMEKFLVRR